jgi:hypothetical protein
MVARVRLRATGLFGLVARLRMISYLLAQLQGTFIHEVLQGLAVAAQLLIGTFAFSLQRLTLSQHVTEHRDSIRKRFQFMRASRSDLHIEVTATQPVHG